jgi:peptidoglycan/LPS O-acetylase OafA/YrhL
MSNVKKRDDEKLMTIIVCAIFTVGMLIVLFTAGNVWHMGVGLSGLAFGAVIACAVAWVVVLTNMYDPNKDYWRLLCILFALTAIITIMGHRGAWLNQVKSSAPIEYSAP